MLIGDDRRYPGQVSLVTPDRIFKRLNVCNPLPQCPTEYPYHLGSGESAGVPPHFLGSSRPVVQNFAPNNLCTEHSGRNRPGILVNAIPSGHESMVCGGTPKRGGSQNS